MPSASRPQAGQEHHPLVRSDGRAVLGADDMFETDKRRAPASTGTLVCSHCPWHSTLCLIRRSLSWHMNEDAMQTRLSHSMR